MLPENGVAPVERESLLAAVEAAGAFVAEGWRRPAGSIAIGATRWTPDFIRPGGALCLITGPSIPGFLEKRLKAAKIAGLELVCVVAIEALISSDVCRLLSEIDARVALLSDRVVGPPSPLLKLMGEEEIAVDPETRRVLIRDGLAACRTATTKDMKGKRLEWLLHFMFSQVRDFRVKQCNYRTATEELDVVIQLSNFDPSRCWCSRGPIVLCEAKNQVAKTGQGVISKFNTVMAVKRGACKIGFVVSLSGFTSDAEKQVLKLAMEDRVIVLLDENHLMRWCDGEDYDAELNELVVEAILD